MLGVAAGVAVNAGEVCCALAVAVAASLAIRTSKGLVAVGRTVGIAVAITPLSTGILAFKIKRVATRTTIMKIEPITSTAGQYFCKKL